MSKKVKEQRNTTVKIGEVAGITKDTDIYAGFINGVFYNPDPVLQTQGNLEGIKLYDKLLSDPQIASVLQTRIMGVVSKKWDIIPAQTGKVISLKDKQIKDFVQNALSETNFMEAKKEILQAIVFGYYVVEVIYYLDNGQIKIKKLISKHPRRFRFDYNRNLHLLTWQNPIYGELLPARKFIVLSYGDTDNPYGKGLGRILYWSVWFKKNGIKFWVVFLEKFGMPTVVAKYPRGIPNKDKEELSTVLDSIQTETGIRVPEDVAITLLEASRAGNPSYETLCNYMDAQISKTVLGQTLTTDIGKTGSFAASKTHNEVRQEIVEADAKMLDETLNNTLIKWLVDLNFAGVTNYPKIKTITAEKPDLNARNVIDSQLVKDGVKISQQYFYDTYGIPKPLPDEDIVSPIKAPPAGGGFSEFKELEHGQKIIDSYAFEAAVIANTIIEHQVDEIISKIKNAKSMAEVGNIIYTMYPHLDTNNFQNLLARTMFAAGIEGYGASQNEK